jgi:type IV pilus assembly protein PilW
LTTRGRGRLPARQRGLTLVELMVSITLGLMILSGVLTVFFNASAARNEVERTSRQIENGRHAVQILSTDLRLAGFYGEFDPGSAPIPASLPADPCSLSAADWVAWLPFLIYGFDNVGFSSANCPIANRKAGTDVFVLRRARTCLAGVAGCEPAAAGLPYLQVSLCASEATSHRIGLEGGATFDLMRKDCAGPAEKRQYYTHIYYVSADNGMGDNVPTLMRLELAGGAWTTVPLVEGIEEFQIEYGMDNDGDGAPDAYVANPSDFPKGACTGACPVNNWLNVVTTRIHILARNLDASPGYTDVKTYELGSDEDGNPVTVTPGGAFRRHVYGSLVRIANAAGRRDKP